MNRKIDEVLDFAVTREEEAVRFYLDLAVVAKKPAMKEVFRAFAKEEEGHKARLEAMKKQGKLASSAGKVADLKMADYLVADEVTPNLDYQQALVIAMKKEKASFKLYTDLAAAVSDESVRPAFLALALEEARHKLRFEIEYDEHVMREN
jgi:rubrerythrin